MSNENIDKDNIASPTNASPTHANKNIYPNLEESLVPDMDILNHRKKNNNIEIKVVNPVTIDETFSKHVVYTVKGKDDNGDFEVTRRYKDFDKIRGLLLSRWPGCYVPPLPPKALLNNHDVKFIEMRRKMLEVFMERVSDLPYLYYSEEFQSFVRSSSVELEKAMVNLSKINPEDIIAKYGSNFSHLSGRELNNEVLMRITSFKLFLHKTQGHFENFRKITENVAKARREFYSQLGLFHTQVCMEYEKNIFSEYHNGSSDRNIFYDPSNFVLHDRAEKIGQAAGQPSLEYLYEWIKSECREIDAFVEAINQRDIYENLKFKCLEKQKSDTNELQKVLSGSFTMKTMFSRKTKDEEVRLLENEIARAGKEMESYTMLHDMITLILAYGEMDKFKDNKLPQYYYVVKVSAENELGNVTNMIDYWSMVMKSDNVKPKE